MSRKGQKSGTRTGAKSGTRSEKSYLYGLNTLQSILETTPERVLVIYLEQNRKDDRIQGIMELASRHGINIQPCQHSLFEKNLGDANHQGVMAEIKPISAQSENALYDLLDSIDAVPFLLCLDGVTDPHNLGACLRTADAAGVQAVIVPKDNACSLNATVSKVASGAAELMPFITVTNLTRCLRELKERGIWCVGLAGEAQQDLYETDLKGPLALIMGAEGKGLRRLTAETCDSLASLPMHGHVSSLNVSVTTGIALYEAVRQRV